MPCLEISTSRYISYYYFFLNYPVAQSVSEPYLYRYISYFSQTAQANFRPAGINHHSKPPLIFS